MSRSKKVRDDSELRRLTESAALDRAFRLAHSIYRFREQDREVALEIVWEALKGVGVRLVAQREADRHDPQKPTKVRWNTLQWLQLLIYYKSEIYEKRQEDAASQNSLTQEDMIIRYVKHLILTTSRRNSFHITLGLTRLLYDYGTAEAMRIYDLIFQDPDVSTKKADAYYRGRKNRLIGELAKRFGGLLRIDQEARGGKRFQPQPDSSQFADLVVRCLTRFTPWETSCALPTPLDTWAAVHSLRGSQASQIHSLIHPLCFSRIVGALKLDPPEKCLKLPLFFLSKGRGGEEGPPDDGTSLRLLTEDEAASIREKVREEERRRKKFSPQSLRILVDGNELARLEPARSNQVRLDIDDDATLIEVVGVEGEVDLLLATHVLMEEENGSSEHRAREYSLVLEGGQKISLSISRAAGDAHSLSVEISYQETVAQTATGWRRFTDWLARAAALKNLRWRPLLSPKAAIALAALLLTGLILYVALSSRSRVSEEVARQQPTPAIIETPTPAPTPSPSVNVTPERTPSPPQQKPPDANDNSRPGTTRDSGERAVKSPASIERLYIGLAGDDAFSREVRRKLTEKLGALNRFAITGSQEEADTALAGVVRSEGKRLDASTGQEVETGSAILELLNIHGEVIWRSRGLRGTADEMTSEFADKLLGAIRAEAGRRKP